MISCHPQYSPGDLAIVMGGGGGGGGGSHPKDGGKGGDLTLLKG